jgi:protein tyrosine/serine phosphatase
LENKLNNAVLDLISKAAIARTPIVVRSVAEMTDTSKLYVLASSGKIWAYMTGVPTEECVTEQIEGTADNPYEIGRLSDGSANGTSGYVTTPYIDLQKYSCDFDMCLYGITFSHEYTANSNLRYSLYGVDKSHITTELTNGSSLRTRLKNISFHDLGDGQVELAFEQPVVNKSDVPIGYIRFSGQGTEADADVSISYWRTVTEDKWVDTGISYAGTEEEIVDITSFILANPSVKGFIESEDYNDNDYSYSNIGQYSGSDYYRKDLPLPIVINWEKDNNALEYTVTIDDRMYYTKDNKAVIYNLLPNTTYYYKIYGLYADSTTKLLKSGNFVTSNAKTRMLNIDGIQNVRDIGGYIGYNSLTVNYGLIYRGSAMDEEVAKNLRISDKGKRELLERVGVKTDLDLRYGYSTSPLNSNVEKQGTVIYDVDFINVASGYDNYATAITNSTQKANFKTLFESVVTQLTNSKPIYVHCSGGCDRTGTFIFLLLGLLGVSESDLAKEYELSSFSSIGNTRTRNSTKYSEMVSAIKTFSGDTITEKFEAFATDCGITSDTITSFRNLMLE